MAGAAVGVCFAGISVVVFALLMLGLVFGPCLVVFVFLVLDAAVVAAAAVVALVVAIVRGRADDVAEMVDVAARRSGRRCRRRPAALRRHDSCADAAGSGDEQPGRSGEEHRAPAETLARPQPVVRGSQLAVDPLPLLVAPAEERRQDAIAALRLAHRGEGVLAAFAAFQVGERRLPIRGLRLEADQEERPLGPEEVMRG